MRDSTHPHSRTFVARAALLPALTVLAVVGPLLAAAAISPGPSSANRPRPTTASPTHRASTGVTIVDFAFQSPSITINPGDTVTWTDQGFAMHSVTADGGAFDSGPNCPSACLSNGQTFSHTFNSPGVYAYHCRIHGAAGGVGMSGTVTVREIATTVPSTTPTTAPTTPPVSPPPTPTVPTGPSTQPPATQQPPATGTGTTSPPTTAASPAVPVVMSGGVTG